MFYAVPETRKICRYSVACLPERKYIYFFFSYLENAFESDKVW